MFFGKELHGWEKDSDVGCLMGVLTSFLYRNKVLLS